MAILPGTALACVVPSASNRVVYYQDAEGDVHETINSGEWKQSGSGLFSAKLLSPLAAVAWAEGKEVIHKCQP
jgi:hypothetical protein